MKTGYKAIPSPPIDDNGTDSVSAAGAATREGGTSSLTKSALGAVFFLLGCLALRVGFRPTQREASMSVLRANDLALDPYPPYQCQKPACNPKDEPLYFYSSFQGEWNCDVTYYRSYWAMQADCLASRVFGDGCNRVGCEGLGYDVLVYTPLRCGEDYNCFQEGYIKADKPVPPCCGDSYDGCDVSKCSGPFNRDYHVKCHEQECGYCDCFNDCLGGADADNCSCDEGSDCCTWATTATKS